MNAQGETLKLTKDSYFLESFLGREWSTKKRLVEEHHLWGLGREDSLIEGKFQASNAN